MRLRSIGRGGTQTLVVYGLAAVIYITVGVFFVDLMLSVIVAMGYLLLATWLLPAAIRRLR